MRINPASLAVAGVCLSGDDPKLAEPALAEQGLDSFIASLKKGGAL